MLRSLALVLALLLLSASPARACEPIVPLMKVLGGPLFMVPSLVALLAFVAVKCAAFAYLQDGLPRGRAALYLLAGNGITTVIGIMAGLAMAVPTAGVVILPLLFVASWVPSRRLVETVDSPRIKALGARGVSFVLAGLFVASVVLFALAQGVASVSLPLYWTVKYAYVLAALAVSIVLTTFWEEWTVTKLSARAGLQGSFAVPVLRANLLVFLLASLTAAWMILPDRLRSSDFLVELVGRLLAAA